MHVIYTYILCEQWIPYKSIQIILQKKKCSLLKNCIIYTWLFLPTVLTVNLKIKKLLIVRLRVILLFLEYICLVIIFITNYLYFGNIIHTHLYTVPICF